LKIAATGRHRNLFNHRALKSGLAENFAIRLPLWCTNLFHIFESSGGVSTSLLTPQSTSNCSWCFLWCLNQHFITIAQKTVADLPSFHLALTIVILCMHTVCWLCGCAWFLHLWSSIWWCCAAYSSFGCS